jgi:hypothetical protein
VVYLKEASGIDDELDFMTSQNEGASPRTEVKNEPACLDVVFDGNPRYSCNFNVRRNDKASSYVDDDALKTVSDCIIGKLVDQKNGQMLNYESEYVVELSKFNVFPDHKQVEGEFIIYS